MYLDKLFTLHCSKICYILCRVWLLIKLWRKCHSVHLIGSIWRHFHISAETAPPDAGCVMVLELLKKRYDIESIMKNYIELLVDRKYSPISRNPNHFWNQKWDPWAISLFIRLLVCVWIKKMYHLKVVNQLIWYKFFI